MKGLRHALTALAALSISLGSVSAAERAHPPREPGTTAGTWALGGDLGFSNTTGDGDFDAEPVMGGFAEYFVTNHASVRGQLSLIDFNGPSALQGPGTGDVNVVALTGNALYHWDAGQVRPYLSGGIGIYNYDPDFGSGDNELGLNGGGGLDIFVTRRIAVELQTLLHGTTEDRGPDSFLTASGSVRFEF